jgi:hypothetical protein
LNKNKLRRILMCASQYIWCLFLWCNGHHTVGKKV